jgi:F0F1-type ATP synthase assembly protein I
MADEDNDEVNRRSGVAYAAALSLFFSVAALAGVGLLLDRWLESKPWFLVCGVILGAALGFYEFIRLTSRLS